MLSCPKFRCIPHVSVIMECFANSFYIPNCWWIAKLPTSIALCIWSSELMGTELFQLLCIIYWQLCFWFESSGLWYCSCTLRTLFVNHHLLPYQLLLYRHMARSVIIYNSFSAPFFLDLDFNMLLPHGAMLDTLYVLRNTDPLLLRGIYIPHWGITKRM